MCQYKKTSIKLEIRENCLQETNKRDIANIDNFL